MRDWEIVVAVVVGGGGVNTASAVSQGSRLSCRGEKGGRGVLERFESRTDNVSVCSVYV